MPVSVDRDPLPRFVEKNIRQTPTNKEYRDALKTYLPFVKANVRKYRKFFPKTFIDDLISIGRVSIWHSLQCYDGKVDIRAYIYNRIRWDLVLAVSIENKQLGESCKQTRYEAKQKISEEERKIGRELSLEERVKLLNPTGSSYRKMSVLAKLVKPKWVDVNKTIGLSDLGDDAETETEGCHHSGLDMLAGRHDVEDRLNALIDIKKFTSWIDKLPEFQRSAMRERLMIGYNERRGCHANAYNATQSLLAMRKSAEKDARHALSLRRSSSTKHKRPRAKAG